MLRAARAWRVAPTVFMRQRPGVLFEYDSAGRVLYQVDWTDADTELAMALEVYEAGLCPGCQHPLDETSRPEHQDAYQAEPAIRCNYCVARALVSKAAEDADDNTAGLLIPLTLNPDVVELNLMPVPPLPPELAVE